MSVTIKTTDYKKFVINGKEVPFSSLDRILPDDKVVSSGDKWSMVVRGKQPPLVGVLDCLNKTRYGFTAKNVPIYLFQPMNKAYPPFRVGSTIEPTQNYLIVIQYETWELGQSMPRGSLVQNLGAVGDFEAEANALYWLYSPWTGYTKKTSEYKPKELDVTDRTEILKEYGWTTINVDPDGCEDIDDCFSYKWDEHDLLLECAITIADVAELVEQNSVIDQTSRKAGQSLYQDGTKPRHMLPSTVAVDYGSLSPGDQRVGISLFFIYNVQENRFTNFHFKETLIVNQKSYTYDSVKLSEHAGTLTTLCKALAKSDDDVTDPHTWIATLMILYNTMFAEYIQGAEGGLLRAHSAPDADRLIVLKAIDPALSFLAMSSATYVPATTENPFHYGLDTEVYTHASSPLRRYADLHNQRVFKEIYHGSISRQPSDHSLISELNQKAKDAKKYERDYDFLKAVFNTDNKILAGTVVGLKQKDSVVRIEVWVPAWKRIIKMSLAGTLADSIASVVSRDEKSSHTLAVGQNVNLAFSFDSTKCKWKERMIYRLL
jgi:exoribonuclease R